MFVLLLIIFGGGWSEGCLDHERFALLRLKHFFTDPYDKGATDCCQWEGVECSNTTGRVIGLYLSETYSGEYWYLNASLFTPFQQLESLDLSWNNIAGCAENEGLEGLSRLNNLKMLDLSGNAFNNNVLSSLARLSSLRSLYLSDNRLEGSIDVKELDSLRDLEELDIGGNKIDKFMVSKGLSKLKSLGLSGTGFKGTFDVREFDSFNNLEVLDMSGNEIDNLVVPQGLERLSRLSKLKKLDLRGNLCNNSILSSVARLSSLTSLHLSHNILQGSIDAKEFDSLSNLEELDINDNEIDNVEVSRGYRGLRKLKSLDLSGVGIRDGNKLLQSMGSFPSLNTLHLESNNFTATLTTTQELHNFTNLEYLTLDDSSLHISLLQSIGSIFTSLKNLSMSGCEVNGVLSGQGFPHFKSLEHLDMRFARIALNTSFLQIIGESMPSLKYLSLSGSTLGTNSSRILDQGLCPLAHLQELYIDNNDLRGSLPWCLANTTSLRILDVSFNQLTGSISSSPLVHLTSIEELRLSNNHFRIPVSLEPLFNHSKLKIFDAKNNEINGEINESHSLTPKFQLKSLSLSSNYGDSVTFPKFLYHQHELKEAELSHIKMIGEFPNWLLENNTKLEFLYLVNDSLAGPFRLPIHSHKRLRFLDVSNNNFQGHIPVEIGDILPSLVYFNISMNALDGSIPSSFGNVIFLQFLDLSNNKLTGEIPDHLAMCCVNLEFLSLSNNSLKGHIFSRIFSLRNLRWLLLEGNHFVGEIPQSLSKCSSLKGLYLNNNNLSGKIPRWLGNLKGLQHIVMPKNHLEGPIPVEFCRLDSLQILDISDNNISGSLPSCFYPLSIKQVHLSKNMLHGQLKEGTFFNCSSLVTLDLSYNYLNGSIPDWIDGLSQLSHLNLAHNNLEGEVPIQLCRLNQLQLLDLSDNNLHGLIPSCFDNTTLHESYNNNSSPDKPFKTSFSISGPQGSVEKKILEIFEFTTKNIAYAYQGRVLSLLAGLDLSCNKLVGHIPPQIGNLTRIQTLNLSHNNLTGTIPLTFSNLRHIESLDLSYNKLSGKIPHQLVDLNTLAIFIVAYNNLSGKIPEWTAQFATFNKSSYDGNPFLCGLPLPICRSLATMSEASTSNEGDDNLIDMDSFFITFTISYVIVIFGIVVVLYVNPYWRRRWLYLVEMWITSCYYFVIDNLIPTRFCH
ncbi:retrovirus-related pol polyprotein from transposon RE1 [Citrus sinensis]|uniref:Retrovirus-related pol polyprotein from transposon RE1 n=1 Tax=Citrus sinensis TaxID=2711 RepID=A0ACB8KH60_CITSI|nr:retrovirus-related pol polyprotein from transposon RE1 [Citrus sinensis]